MPQRTKQKTTAFASLHSKRVNWIKRGVIGVLIIMVVAMIVWPLTDYGKRGFKLTFNEVDLSNTKKPSMTKPRFHGKDKLGRPFNIIADNAIQLSEKEVELHSLDADIILQNGNRIIISAETGKYNQEKKTVNLRKDIVIISDDGYKIYTDEANAWIDENRITGDLPVTVNGPMGRLYAKKFDVQDMGKVMRFYGGVNLRTIVEKM